MLKQVMFGDLSYSPQQSLRLIRDLAAADWEIKIMVDSEYWSCRITKRVMACQKYGSSLWDCLSKSVQRMAEREGAQNEKPRSADSL